jgi:hypothetical protein
MGVGLGGAVERLAIGIGDGRAGLGSAAGQEGHEHQTAREH